MSNTFEFAEQLGFTPSFQFTNNTDRTGFYKEHIDFKKLVKTIKAAKPNLFNDFNYQNYVSKQKSREEVKDRETDEIFIAEYITDVPFTIKDDNGKDRNLLLYGELNKKLDNVRTDMYISRTIIKPKDREVSYNILFVYEGFDGRKNSSDRSDINRVAITISTHFYEDYKAAYNYLGYKNTQIERDVFNKFTKAFSESENEPFDLAFVYNQAPNFVLQKRDTQLLWKDLFTLLKGFVLESKEKAILKVLRALAIDEANISPKNKEEKQQFATKVNVFFHTLMLQKNGVSIFEKLYNKLNNYGFGDDNFTALINTLYAFWKLSDFKDPNYYRNKNEYQGGPETLPYQNTKVLGFYNNNFEFNFVKEQSRLKIKAIKEEVTFEKNNYSRRPRKKVTKTNVATYNLFHPIQLAEIPETGELKIPDKIVPAFFLKAMDDLNKWSNLEDGILLTVDVVTTLTGVGNLYKLRHLRHLTKLKNIKPISTLLKVKTAVSFVEVTAGTLNIMLKLADSNSPFAQKLQQYLFWLELASLGTDAVVEKLLKKSAKEALDIADKAGDILDPKVREILELTAGVKIKRRYRKATFNDIELLSKIRKNIDAGWNKNIAYTKGKIGDKIIDLQSRSGKQTGTSKDYDNFKTIKDENYYYRNGPEPHKLSHTEQKQIEYLYNKYKNNKNVLGQIEIVSDLKICSNCDWLIDVFQKDFPNIEITRVWVRVELKK